MSLPTDKKPNTLWQLSLTSPAPVCHSVGNNNITGDAANHLATVVLEHAIMTDFCGIPLASLHENSITELDLEYKGVGVPGAIVLSKLLPSAAALTSLKCAPARVFSFLPCPLTLLFSHHARSAPHPQSLRQPARSRRSSCSRGGPQGQLDAAIPGVGRP